MAQKTLVTVEDARNVVLATVSRNSPETSKLSAVRGRVAATDIVAPENLPAFDNASMDGFGLHLVDRKSHGLQTLTVVGESAAGHPFSGKIGSDQAIRIMTGAPVPPDVNAVIEVELVEETGKTIRISEVIAPGRNIRHVGDDVKSGETIIPSGTLLGSFHVGILAALGIDSISVIRKPRVSVVTTGSELVDVSGSPVQGKIRNSSAYLVPAMITESGAECISTTTIEDEPEALKKSLRDALKSDVVITTGGISAGTYDLVPGVLGDLGVDLKFRRVKIKPGMPMAFGVSKSGIPVFCLPGNPVSTAVTFLQFVRPALYAMLGLKQQSFDRYKADLQHDISKRDVKRHFVRGILEMKDGKFTVRSAGSQSSGVLSSLVRANCLMVLPEDLSDAKAGTAVDVELL